jgi:DNA-binding GntR family transcriptional regulator
MVAIPPRRRAVAPEPDVPLDQAVFDALFDAMMAGRLKPGDRLGEVQLCERFKVSRTVVRKALHRLAEQRVVDITAHKGAAVASPSPQEAREVFEARRAVEGAIIRRLAQTIGHSDLERLRARLGAEHAAVQSHDHARWVALAGGFHQTLAQMAGNSVLQRMLAELATRCTLIVALYEKPGNAHCEHHEHERLVDLLSLRDADGAAALMDEHLVSLQSRLCLPDPA